MAEVEVLRILDNLETGSLKNIEHLLVDQRVEFIPADIRDFGSCRRAAERMDVIFHEAAIGSVPRSIQDPVFTNECNISGTLNMFVAARENKVKKVVYASSSSVYGDQPDLPKQEKSVGNPLSPYAVSKQVGELYAKVFANLYDLRFIGFRYFNVFGPRQSPLGPYAAVIPIFFREMMQGRSPLIHGNGEQSRDFTYVQNIVDLNLATLYQDHPSSWNRVYNGACGQKTALTELYRMIASLIGFAGKPAYGPQRTGDIQDSLADISAAGNLLAYKPNYSLVEGLQLTYEWYQHHPEFLSQ
jgi:UDP-N-acetylglucosamine 4-epimerase